MISLTNVQSRLYLRHVKLPAHRAGLAAALPVNNDRQYVFPFLHAEKFRMIQFRNQYSGQEGTGGLYTSLQMCPACGGKSIFVGK